ncbi:MAG: YfhO family protein [Calditrichia bacterium]
MAKVKKSKKQPPHPKSTLVETSPNILDRLEQPKYILGFFILLFALLAFLYQPLVFEGKEPSGSDIITGIGKTKQLRVWEEKTGHYPLWNPYMFGGMPTYHRRGPQVWSIDTLLNKLDFLGDWRLWFFLAGALGIFFLVKYLGLSAAAGMFAALAFVLMPHFQALIIVGHFAKFRAIMFMPYVLLTTLLLIRRRDLLSMLLFALALALQFRIQHYQIMFYTLMLALFMGVPPLYQLIKEKKYALSGKVVGLTVAAGILALLIVSQNLLSIREYTPYSTRGGHAISIQESSETQQEKKGVGFDYATNWSYSLSEWWNLIIPKFHGGTSNEIYTGRAVPGWHGRELPTYWGSMPFTQSYEYLGILVVFLALVAILFQWNRWEVKSLTLLTALALLMSLGKNFAVLYRLFFYYVPYFDKFRVPMMILTLVMFTVPLLAAYGLSFLLRADLTRKEISQKFYILSALVVGLVLIPLLFGSSFALSQANEAQRYGQEILLNLKKVRLEMLRASTLTSLLYLVLGIGAVFAVQKKWLKAVYLPLIFLVIIGIDLMVLDKHYVDDKFLNPQLAEQQQYRRSLVDQALEKDPSLYRVFPLGRLFQDTRWSYRYQSIGGYSPAKLQTIQEIVENNLSKSVDGELPINWHVVDMLNGKYVFSNQPLPQTARLKLVASDPQQEIYAYQNSGALPRAFFVQKYQVISDGVERLQTLNQPGFDPRETAILEKELEVPLQAPDSSLIKITTYEPERIVLEVYTDRTALLVLSEMYYPKGWYAYLDGTHELEIYKTNHLLRSVVVPAGNHTLEFRFHPKSYYAGVRISLVSSLIIYILLLILLFKNYRHSLVSRWRALRTGSK